MSDKLQFVAQSDKLKHVGHLLAGKLVLTNIQRTNIDAPPSQLSTGFLGAGRRLAASPLSLKFKKFQRGRVTDAVRQISEQDKKNDNGE